MNLEDTVTAQDMAEMSEIMEAETVKRQVLTLNGQGFYLDSITENAQKTINAIEFVDADIAAYNKAISDTQVKIQISQIARDSLFEKLQAESEKFEPVSEDEVSEG